MTLKVTIFYNQTNRGWTETWYATGNEPPTELTATQNGIMRKAIAFRAALTSIEWVRFSVVGKPQLVNSFRLSTLMAPPPSTIDPPDVVSTDALWRITTAQFGRRTISLRGLYDQSVLRDPVTGAFRPSAFLQAGVDAYLSSVYRAGWLVRTTETKVNTPALEKWQVFSLAPNALDQSNTDVFIVGAVGVPAIGSKVRFTGSIDPRALPLFPRTPTVLSSLAGPPQRFTIPYALPAGATVNLQTTYVTPLVFDYNPINDWAFQSLSKRDTGRPFGSSRGRRTSLGSRR